MKVHSSTSQEAIQEGLLAEAVAAWGVDRAKALGPMIESTAAALWQLSQTSLTTEDEEPDFTGLQHWEMRPPSWSKANEPA